MVFTVSVDNVIYGTVNYVYADNYDTDLLFFKFYFELDL